MLDLRVNCVRFFFDSASCDVQITDNKLGEHRLLKKMMCLEKDLSKDHFETKYDLLTMIRNTGGDGGLALVADDFFDWAKSTYLAAAQAMSPGDIRKKGRVACKSSRALVEGDASLRSDFLLLGIKQGASREVANSVYKDMMEKL